MKKLNYIKEILFIIPGILIVALLISLFNDSQNKGIPKEAVVLNTSLKYDYRVIEEVKENTYYVEIVFESKNGISKVWFPNGTVTKFDTLGKVSIKYTVDTRNEYIFKIQELNDNIVEEKIVFLYKQQIDESLFEKEKDDKQKESIPSAVNNIQINPNTLNLSKSVKITIKYEEKEGYDVYYQLSNSNKWIKYEKEFTLDRNTTIIARYQDKKGNYGEEVSLRISNVDNTPPNKYRPTITTTSNSVTISGSTTDNNTIEKKIKYFYSIDGGKTYSSASGNTYTFKDLLMNYKYSIKIKVQDELGNQIIMDFSATTKNIPVYQVKDATLNDNILTASSVDSTYTLLYSFDGNTFYRYNGPVELEGYGNKNIVFKYVDSTNQEGEASTKNILLARKIYFRKPNEWATPYVSFSGDISVASPGLELDKEDFDLYSVTISDEYLPYDTNMATSNINVVFNNGGSLTNHKGSRRYKTASIKLDDFGKVYTITSGSSSTDGTTTGTWSTLAKRSNAVGRVYFNAPVGWDTPHVYLHTEDNSKELLGVYPGIELTKDETKDYIYYFDIYENQLTNDDISNYLITFNNGDDYYHQKDSTYRYKLVDEAFAGYNKIYNPIKNVKDKHQESTGEWVNYDTAKIGVIPTTKQKVKNIIIMIGDGMGPNHILAGALKKGEELNMQKIPYSTFVRSNSIRSVTDSAASATAMSTGNKTVNGYVGLDADGNVIQNIMEYAHEKHLQTGVVTTGNIPDATPAGFSAHVESRDSSDEILNQQIASNIDLYIGGGQKYFAEKAELLAANNVTYVTSLADVNNVSGRVMAALSNSNISGSLDTRIKLSDITRTTLERLENPNGFITMIEGANIDSKSHNRDMNGMLTELIDFDNAIGYAMEYVDSHPDTLLIITADHETGGLILDGVEMADDLTNALFTSEGSSSANHTDTNVRLFAYGKTASNLTAYDLIDNTSIYHYVKSLLPE